MGSDNNMKLTLTPKTEAMLLARAESEGEDVNTLLNALLVYALQEEDRDHAEMMQGIQRGLEASAAGRVRPLSEFMAEMNAKYKLPTHLSDEEIFAGEEGITHK